nr:MAG TPA: zinc-ribbon containing domain protein [Caudoviricetes sp.]
MVCKYCGYNMSNGLRLCPQCGKSTEHYNRNIEKVLEAGQPKRKRSFLYDYSEEEQLALGLYPKDETYKMSLISRILGRR